MPDDTGSNQSENEPPSPKEILKAMMDVPSPAYSDQWEVISPEELDLMLPDFSVSRLIGKGGMGTVYEAVQLSLDRKVAIKLLPIEVCRKDSEFEVRFKREALALARLSHPNITQIHDFNQTESGHYYIVMELVDGKDLREVIQQGPVKPETAFNIAVDICDALFYAHQKGYIHRDIKPSNIFLDKEGVIKVGDFGIAKLIDLEKGSDLDKENLTVSGYSMGTPQYAAPEVTKDFEKIDHRSDIYSFGVLLYELLTGEVPLGALDPPSGRVKVDPRIDDVVLKAMHTKPERRYQNAKEIETDIMTVRDRPGSRTRAFKEKGKGISKIWRPVSVVAILLACSFVGGIAWKHWEPLKVVSVSSLGTKPGRLKGVGHMSRQGELIPIDLQAAEGIDDFIQVTGRFHDAHFAALRANGTVISNVPFHFKPSSDVVRMSKRTGSPNNLFYIKSDGQIVTSQVDGKMVAGDWPKLKTPVKQAATDGRHGLILLTGGTVIPWGDHYDNAEEIAKLNWLETFRYRPPSEMLTDAIDVEASGGLSVVLKKDGSVLAWDDEKELDLPDQFSSGIVEVDAHYKHGIFARHESGDIWLYGIEEGEEHENPIGRGDRLFCGSPPLFRDHKGNWRFYFFDDERMVSVRHPKLFRAMSEIRGLPPEAFYFSVFNDNGYLFWIEPQG